MQDSNFRKSIDKNIKIERIDIAVNFYLVVEDKGIHCLVTYDYNPVYKSWFPFYDDVNKTPTLVHNTAKTYGELIFECDLKYWIWILIQK